MIWYHDRIELIKTDIVSKERKQSKRRQDKTEQDRRKQNRVKQNKFIKKKKTPWNKGVTVSCWDELANSKDRAHNWRENRIVTFIDRSADHVGSEQDKFTKQNGLTKATDLVVVTEVKVESCSVNILRNVRPVSWKHYEEGWS